MNRIEKAAADVRLTTLECVTPRIPATCADAFVAAAEVAAYATRRNAVMRAMVAATERTANAVGGRTFDVGFR